MRANGTKCSFVSFQFLWTKRKKKKEIRFPQIYFFDNEKRFIFKEKTAQKETIFTKKKKFLCLGRTKGKNILVDENRWNLGENGTSKNIICGEPKI